MSNIIFQISFLKSLLNLLSCHTLIIVVILGQTVLLLFPADYKFLRITLPELSFQLIYEHLLIQWWVIWSGSNQIKDGTIWFLLCYSNVLLEMLLIIFVQNLISLILFMIIIQEAIPQISLVFLIVNSNSSFRTFHVTAANLWNNSVDSNACYNYDSMSLCQFKCIILIFTS